MMGWFAKSYMGNLKYSFCATDYASTGGANSPMIYPSLYHFCFNNINK